MRKLTIAIDGPAGAGKSTIAARLAHKLGYVNLESGAMYRALALKAIEHNVALGDEAALVELARHARIELEPVGDSNRVILDGSDVTQRIRMPDVTDASSRVSVHPQVRVWMVARQREIGSGGGVIMEGRDIGTKVFPHAEVKIFLDAAADVRAERRLLQDPRGVAARKSVQAVAEQIRQRDERDRTRAASPLEPAPDAVIIDSSKMGIDEVVACAEELVRAKLRDRDAGGLTE